MGRPERNTVDFFPHFISEGKKMFFIETKYGNDGYATWFKILEKLASTENHYLDLNQEEEILFLSAKCKVPEEKLLSIVNDLSRIGAFDKKLWDCKVIWSNKFIDEIQEAYKRRNNKCIQYIGLCEHLLSLGILKPILTSIKDDSNTQSRVDKNRREKSRVEESISEPSASDGIYPACMDLYNSFIINKTGVGAKINSTTGSAMNKIISYLKTQVKNKEDFSVEVPHALNAVFTNYDKWLPFHKEQLNLNQIESNLINIINAIKNGKSITTKQSQSKYAS